MTIAARLRWHPPVAITVTRDQRLILAGELGDIPTSRGIYVFAMRTGSKLKPLYVGLASRSLRQRLKQHLRSPRMIEGLRNARPGKRLFFFAELEPGDHDFAKRYLSSCESALIQAAINFGGGNLNTNVRTNRMDPVPEKCLVINVGHREAWSPWATRRILADVLPPRRPAAEQRG